jgi:hypothetical protein
MPLLSYVIRGQSESIYFFDNAAGTGYIENALVAASQTTNGATMMANELARRAPGWTAVNRGGNGEVRWGGTSFVDDWIDPRLGPGNDTPLSGNADARLSTAGRYGQQYFDALDTLIAANNATSDAWCSIWFRQTWESDDRAAGAGGSFDLWPFDIVQYARAVTLFVNLEAAKFTATGKPWRIWAVHPGPTDRGGLNHALMREVVQHLAVNGRRSTRASLAPFAVIPGFYVGGTTWDHVTIANARTADQNGTSIDFAHQALGSSQRSGRQLAIPLARWLSPGTSQDILGNPRVQNAVRVPGSPNVIRLDVAITPGNRLFYQGPDPLDTDIRPSGATDANPTFGTFYVHSAPINTATAPTELPITAVSVDNTLAAAGLARVNLTLASPVPTTAYVSIAPGQNHMGYTRRGEAISTTLKRRLGLFEDGTAAKDLVVDAAMSDLLRSGFAVAMPVLNETNLLVSDSVSTLSDYAEDAMLKWLLTNSAVTRPTAWFLALGTASADGSFTEISGNGYARTAVTLTVSGTTPTLATNGSAVNFPTVTGAGWGTVTHVAVFDASTAGNRLAQGPLASGVAVAAGTGPSFAPGAFDLTLD